MLIALGGVTVISLFIYAFRMRYSLSSGGPLLGASVAATLLVAFLWLLTRSYEFAIAHEFTINWPITGLAAAAFTAFPTIVRFIPILSKPAVRRVVLRVMLIPAGLIIPFGAIALSFWFYYVGNQHIDPIVPAWNPLHYVDGYVLLALLAALFGAIAMFLLNINLTAPIGSIGISWRGRSSTSERTRRGPFRFRP